MDSQETEELRPVIAPAPEPFPPSRAVFLARTLELRYGENPHQRAALYRIPDQPDGTGPFPVVVINPTN